MHHQPISPTLCPAGFRGVFTDATTLISKNEFEVIEWSPSGSLVKFRNLTAGLGNTFWEDAPKIRLIEALPMRSVPLRAQWTYSTYRASLYRDGQQFAIVSPDGRNALAPDEIVTLLTALNGVAPETWPKSS